MNSCYSDWLVFCYVWKVSYCLNHSYCYCWNCYVFCYNFVIPDSNNCYCGLFVRRVKPRLNFFCQFRKQNKKRPTYFYLNHSLLLNRNLVLSFESPPSFPPSSNGGDFAFAKSIIIGFIWWLEPLKKPEEEKWPSLPSSSPASSLLATSIPPAQKVPEIPISWSAQKKKFPEDYANERAKYVQFFIGNRILPILELVEIKKETFEELLKAEGIQLGIFAEGASPPGMSCYRPKTLQRNWPGIIFHLDIIDSNRSIKAMEK